MAAPPPPGALQSFVSTSAALLTVNTLLEALLRMLVTVCIVQCTRCAVPTAAKLRAGCSYHPAIHASVRCANCSAAVWHAMLANTGSPGMLGRRKCSVHVVCVSQP
jgi:hypothetical protein